MLYHLALAVLTFLPNPVHAQSSGPPTFSMGDEWTRSTGQVQKVVKIDGDNVVITGIGACPTCLGYYDKNLGLLRATQADGTPPDTSAGFIPAGGDWKLYEFPLEVGKKWHFSANGIFRNNVNHYDFVNTVEAYEDVTTKAGTFKAFRIRREVSIRPLDNRGRGASWTTTEWFSPAAKWLVKWASTNPNQREWELTAYNVK
jgi:hypothetical protein